MHVSGRNYQVSVGELYVTLFKYLNCVGYELSLFFLLVMSVMNFIFFM